MEVRWALLSWNVAARTARWPDQFAAVRRLDPDVVTLQEVTAHTAGLWREALIRSGWRSFIFSFDLAPQSFLPTGPRRYGLVLAPRFPLASHDPQRFPVPWQERVLSATSFLPNGRVEITTTHVPPGSSNGWIKVEHLEGLRLGLAAGSSINRLLCGDFKTPRRELPTGEVITFGQTEAGRLTELLELDGTPRSATSCSGSLTSGCQMSFERSTDTNRSPPAGSSNAETLASRADSTTSSPTLTSDLSLSHICTSYERAA